MPELPDIAVYIERLDTRVRGSTLLRMRTLNALVLRTAVPPAGAVKGQRVQAIARMGKRSVIALSRLLKASWPMHIDDIE